MRCHASWVQFGPKLLPAAAQWRTQMNVCFHAGDAHSCHSSYKVSSTRASDWDCGGGSAGLSADLRSGGKKKEKQNTGIWLKSPEGERMERERWNGSVASKRDLNISRLCSSLCGALDSCWAGWLTVTRLPSASRHNRRTHFINWRRFL